MAAEFVLDKFSDLVKWPKDPMADPTQNPTLPSVCDNKPNPKPNSEPNPQCEDLRTSAVGSNIIGFSSEKRVVGFWPIITKANLCDNAALLQLHVWYALHGMVPDSESGQHIVFEAAQHALEKGKRNKPGLFVHRLRNWNTGALHPIGERIRDRAHARWKQAVGYDSDGGERSEAR